MDRVVDYLMEEETAIVFDIDGVLAPYEFGVNCHSIVDDDEWMELVRSGDPYGAIPPVKLIQRMIESKRTDRVFVCSVSSPDEYEGKQRFATGKYGIPSQSVRFVSSKGEKLDMLRLIAGELGLCEERVAIVEDTVKTLDSIAQQSAFVTVHVSSLFAFDE